MKKGLICFLLFLSLPFFMLGVSVEKVGEWGAGEYKDVFVKGNYAYCAAEYGGVDIIDIRDASSPKKVSGYDTEGRALAVFVKDHFAFVADGDNGLVILDASNIFSPVLVGHYGTTRTANGVYVDGHYVYMTDGGHGFMIIDISNPRSPSLLGDYAMDYARNIIVRNALAYVVGDYGVRIVDVSDPSDLKFIGSYNTPGFSMDIDLKDNFLYLANDEDGFRVLDVSNPAKPGLVGEISTSRLPMSVQVVGNHAYIVDRGGVQVIDVSDPSAMTVAGDYESTTGSPVSVFVSNSKAYTADEVNGLHIIDVSNVTAPSFLGKYDSSGFAWEVRGSGNYLYVAHGVSGLQILDASNPAKLKSVSSYDTTSIALSVEVVGPYAYLVDTDDGLIILDVSDPSSPRFLGSIETPGNPLGLFLGGNYAYIAVGDPGIVIFDVSNPSSPVQVGSLSYDGYANNLWLSGSTLYIADGILGFVVVDVSDPSAPVLKSTFEYIEYGVDLFIHGNLAYVAGAYNGLFVLDISDPSSVSLLGNRATPGWVMGMSYSYSDYIFLADGGAGYQIADVYDPTNIRLSGGHDTPGWAHSIYMNGDYAYIADGGSGKVQVFSTQFWGHVKPKISLSRDSILFTTDNDGANTGTQSVRIENIGGGTLNWITAISADWLKCSPSSGVNSGEVFLSIDATGFAPGAYTTHLIISDFRAEDSPAVVEVTLQVYQPGQTAHPFGTFATPLDGSTVSSSVPFTGWVLDDIAVLGVQLFREPVGGKGSLVYIGDAVFVEGARPDVAQTYPGYPNNTKAGWGYMMLTNFLPGDGVYTIHAIATDAEGHQVTLGAKTITVDNANAVKPFGAIDTPVQGGTASGDKYVNFGWVLTPQPNTIPTDGSTITVWVDGVSVGQPVYDQYRSDIAALFPGYANTDGAVGYFILNTTAYANGVHTIQWTAKDDAGNTDGIGSRYFTVKNTVYRESSQSQTSACSSTIGIQSLGFKGLDRSLSPVGIRKGYDDDAPKRMIYPNDRGVIRIHLKELERLQLDFQGPVQMGSPLPIGSTLDKEKEIFYWQPGAGFVGEYRFWFLVEGVDSRKGWMRQKIIISIKP
jgi:hypothetical protein